MKKNIITIAIAAIALISSSSLFAQQSDNNRQNDKKKVENNRQRKMERRQFANPFEGLNLTEQQQNSLKALAEEQQKALKQQKENKKAERDKEKINRKETMKNSRKEYLAKIKGILTAEQYTQFLENNYINQSKDLKKFGKEKSFKGKNNMRGKMADGKNKGLRNPNGKRAEKKTNKTQEQA